MVEPLPRDRLEQAAEPQLDGRDPVEGRVQRRERQGAGGDVGRHHAVGVPGGVQRLDPAAGSEVERARDRGRDHEPAEGGGCAAHPEHVVLVEGAAGGELAQVGCDPPLADAVRVDEAVGTEVDRGSHAVAVDLDEAEALGAVEAERRQGDAEVGRVDGVPEHEQGCERGGRGEPVGAAGGRDGATGRDPVPPVQRLPGRVAPDPERRRERERGRLEVSPQRPHLGGRDGHGRDRGAGHWSSLTGAAPAAGRVPGGRRRGCGRGLSGW
ncbi:hypothetical protein ABID70_001717 [Clavibacter michiganensis]